MKSGPKITEFNKKEKIIQKKHKIYFMPDCDSWHTQADQQW